MDEIKMVSDFATKMISKMLAKILFKKTGFNVDIDVNSIQFIIDEDKVKGHLDLRTEMSKDDFESIIASIS